MRIREAIIIGLALTVGCTGTPKPKFADVAVLLCDGLEDFAHLHNEILAIHLQMDQGNYSEALRIADALLLSLDETKDLAGTDEVRALIFILKSIVKGTKP